MCRFFVRELIRHEESIDNMELMLFLGTVPDLSLPKEEIIFIANKILRMDPNNKHARSVIDKCI